MYFNQPEGTGYEVLDPAFNACLIGHARVERLWTGARWTEGPAWFPASRSILFSDIPNNRMMRLDEADGHVSVFRHPANNSNGNTTDGQGRLVSCEHLTRRVTRTEHDGTITVLADRFEGKRFNSPNDVVVKSDGAIWFTDPSYGIMADYEGAKATSEIGRSNVYRIDGTTGEVTCVADDFVQPNGLGFSRDEKTLYIADSGITSVPKHIRAFDVSSNGKSLGTSRVFADCTFGLFDGFRVDRDGRIWTSAGDGVHCYLPNGTLIGKILIPELVANVCFGGQQKNRLFICGCTSIYSVYLAING
jgi:gluconolactonase